MRLSLIAAYGKNKEIGYQNSLPWKLPSDLKHFKDLTQHHTVIMGRKTAESIGKPLPNRTNIVITHQPTYQSGYTISSSLDHALSLIPPTESEAFIIGGAAIYAQALLHIERMYITQVEYSGPADTFFPNLELTDWQITSTQTPTPTENDQYKFTFIVYDRCKHD